MLHVFVGYDRTEETAYQVCVRSLLRHASQPVWIEPVLQPHLRALGIYRRPHRQRIEGDWDMISDRPMSTEFAVSRFAVPLLNPRNGWVLWCDCDFLWRADVAELFALADPKFAAMVVKHAPRATEPTKMEGCQQVDYPRKWWSSLVLWNTSHPANARLTAEDLNTRHRDWLHGFGWLADDDIGALPEEWNRLVGLSDGEAKAAHFTLGCPDRGGCMQARFADEWRAVLDEVRA